MRDFLREWWPIILVLICSVWVLLKALDDLENYEKGVSIYTDEITNCQYLKTLWDGITPRLKTDGTPMCKKIEEGF